MLTTTWPVGGSLWRELPEGARDAVSMDSLDELVADATASVLGRIDPTKLPTDTTQCPRTVAKAILLEAHRLRMRPDTPGGVLSFGGDSFGRIASRDPDIEQLLVPWGLDPEP